MGTVWQLRKWREKGGNGYESQMILYKKFEVTRICQENS